MFFFGTSQRHNWQFGQENELFVRIFFVCKFGWIDKFLSNSFNKKFFWTRTLWFQSLSKTNDRKWKNVSLIVRKKREENWFSKSHHFFVLKTHITISTKMQELCCSTLQTFYYLSPKKMQKKAHRFYLENMFL